MSEHRPASAHRTRRAGPLRLAKRHPALSVLCVLALALLVGVGGWVWVLNSRLGDIPRFDAELDRPGRPERVEGSALNVLLVGVDAGPGHDLREQLQTGDWVEGSFRSDTMMVWHLSEDRDSSQVVSLPRDAWVEIPGRGRAKLNAAFSFGGPRLLAHTLEETAGVFVDHVVVVDFEGFAEVTETLGGVEVPMADGTTSRLEGAEALAYVRDRKSLPEGDFDRIDRQQHFLRAVLEQAVSGSRTNPLRLTGLVGDLAELVVLDSEFDQGLIRSLAMTITRKGAGEFTWLTAPHHGTATIDGQSVVELDVRATRALFQAIARDDFERYRRTHDVDLLPPPDRVD